MIARVERGRAGHRREWISVVDPSGCSSCALVLNSLKRSALVYKGEGNASMSEIRIRNDLRGLAYPSPPPALKLGLVWYFCCWVLPVWLKVDV